MQTPPFTLRSPPRYGLGGLAASAAVALTSLPFFPSQPLVGCLIAAASVVGATLSAAAFWPNRSCLNISVEGFEIRSPFRAAFLKWSEVEGFFPINIAMNKFVGFNYAPTFDRSQRSRAVSVELVGVEGALPDTYGMSSQELAALMNELRGMYSRASA